ncbi:Trk K+ transport system, NAD-binding component [Natronorubrum daqingense]|uniref:Trk K+ transport system, NAD-binding component n=2 Tax=Natronorubrum daqingense TaxID=588898 RepID=A0A1N7EKX6_9EURY|nr:Trk K+ transport system, NAD-binding component [Natronorubrum daqingense]
MRMKLSQWPLKMTSRLRKLSIGQRIALYVVIVAVIVSVYTAAYWYGMAAYEDRNLSLGGALQTVVQSLTTTGYGQDAPWETAIMNLFTIVMQFTGILLLFLLLPLIIVPWFRELIQQRRFDEIEPLEDHIVISGHTPHVHAFLTQIESHDHPHPYVIIEPDADRAATLHDLGHTVYHGDPESESDLRNASVESAQAAIVAGNDQMTVNVALAIRDVAPTVPITATLADEMHRPYLRSAGVDRIVQPQRVIGQSLATRYPIPTGKTSDRIVILGHGTVGETVRSALDTWGSDPTVVDTDEGDHVDIVGDATEKDTLLDAGVENSDAVIVSLPEDRQAVYSTLLIRDLNATAEIFVRVAESDALSRVDRAGADYVLELPDITGRMLAATVLAEPIHGGENVLITRVNGSEVDPCSVEPTRVIGIAREDELYLDPDSEFELREGDILIYHEK